MEDDEEDIFSMLDGIGQATRGHEDGYGGHGCAQGDQIYKQDPRYYDSRYSPKLAPVPADYRHYHEEQHVQGREVLPRSAVNRQQDPDSLATSVYGSYDTALPVPRFDLDQYPHHRPHPRAQASSPPVGLHSSPAFKVSQRKLDQHVSQPQITRQAPSSSACLSYESAYDSKLEQRPNLTHASPQSKQPRFLSTHALPDRFRSIFPYPNFNAMQTRCFPTVYQNNSNFVLSSPTGSGKTVIFELAICHVINHFQAGQFKVVYQAPTKSLCAERQRDWQKKFRMFQLDCAELTGDTDPAQMRNVQSASIIITTPEKWDSVTRNWKDHAKLMNMIKLFLIDEVHMLHDERGATLEAVVSRMKSVHSDVRFIALSATVPNSSDIATWLGRDNGNQEEPAKEERFGEEFRPVLLQKHVAGYPHGGNEFSFEKMLDSKLPDVILRYSHRKPIMVFCFTRKSCESTARVLAQWWASKGPKDRYWQAPQRQIVVENKDLTRRVSSAVAWHHAGLSFADRNAVEQGFINGDINVICCTSTLAVGVNLPCHMVIIKNTVTYAAGEGIKEYSDLEIMQMLGRAGRPQYDTSAVAVIMTRQEKAKRYERMVSGEQILESCLHEHVIEHLNAEIGLGTITNLSSAKKWLTSTFLYVRLRENPEHYHLDDDHGSSDIDARLENICCRDIDLLREHSLIEGENKLESTSYGEAMARYCVRFETAKLFLALPDAAKLSEILSAIALASEWKEIRFRGSEKSSYKTMNKSPQIRFPIPVNLDTPAHKVSLIIQSQLAAVNLPTDEKTAGNGFQYQTDTFLVFQHIRRLIRCIVDFKLSQGDSVSLRNALFMCRSIGARCWDDSPLQLKQLDKVGIAGVRKLVAAGITTIEALEHTEPHKIETILHRNPPFGLQVLDIAKTFPKLRISVDIAGKPHVNAGRGAKVYVNAEIGFINDNPAASFQNKPVFLVFLAETSDGKSVHFARVSGKKVSKGQLVKFSASLTSPNQSINCYVMCDEIAGTCTSATLRPTIPSMAWPTGIGTARTVPLTQAPKNAMNTSKRRSTTPSTAQHDRSPNADEFGDDMLEEDDLLTALYGTGGTEFQHIDTFDATKESRSYAKPTSATTSAAQKAERQASESQEEWHPTQLRNGRWECNHKCKDKQGCKHLCCKDGLDKPPKAPKAAIGNIAKEDASLSATQSKSKLQKGQTTLNLDQPAKSRPPPSMDEDMELMDLTSEIKVIRAAAPRFDKPKREEKLHSVTQNKVAPDLSCFMHQSRLSPVVQGGAPSLSFLLNHVHAQEEQSTDHREDMSEIDLPDDSLQPANRFEQDAAMVAELTRNEAPVLRTAHRTSTTYSYGDSDSLLDEAMIGLADSQALQMRQRPLDIAVVNESHETAYGSTEMEGVETSETLPLISPTARHRAGPSDSAALIRQPPSTKGSSRVSATGTVAPFFGSSGDTPHFSFDRSRSQKRKRSAPDAASEIAEPLTKQQLRFDYDTPAKSMAVEKDESKAEASAEASSTPPLEIDPLIMQMFGSYVDFV